MKKESTLNVAHLERASTWDGATFSLMVGLGEAYVPAFVLALGLGESASGLITTLPLLVGAVLQLFAPLLVGTMGSFRSWVVICALFQAASFLPLIYLSHLGQSDLLIIFLAACVYWAAGMSSGPVWNAWMAKMVPKNRRDTFWGRRTWLSFLGAFIGFFVGGIILHVGKNPMTGFFTLFVSAFILRLASAFFLQMHPERVSSRIPPNSLLTGLKFISKGKGAEYVRFMFFMNFSVYVAAPFFAAFLLKELQVSYLEYVVVIGVALSVKVISTPAITSWVRTHGTKKLMWVSSVGIAALPALWLISQSFYYLVALQFVSGIFWAGLELSFPIFLVNYVPPKERIAVLSLYNLGRSWCLSIGSLVGAVVLQEYGSQFKSYAYLFLLSTALRTLSLLVITRIPTIQLGKFKLFWRTTGVRPSMGTVSPPIVSETQSDDVKISRK